MPNPYSLHGRLSEIFERLDLLLSQHACGELPRRDREMAWKLGYDLLQRDSTGVDAYGPIRPVRKNCLALDFSGFCRRLAARDGLALRGAIPWARLEHEGWRRLHECMRLSLVRQALRRPRELWLVHDVVLHLARQGYRIEIGIFCPPATTPRNILLPAQRS